MHRSRDPDDERSLRSIYAALFFGVPENGMDVTTLRELVRGTSHEFDLALLDQDMGFQFRSNEQEDFRSAFHYAGSEVLYFCERRLSQASIKV